MGSEDDVRGIAFAAPSVTPLMFEGCVNPSVRIYDYDPENRVVVDYETVILTKLYDWILQTSVQLQFWITSTKKTLGRCQARREQDKFIFICLTKENVFS